MELAEEKNGYKDDSIEDDCRCDDDDFYDVSCVSLLEARQQGRYGQDKS
jgi:hypothetical protein